MSDNDFLAFEYASGLLDAEQKQAIKKTTEFEKSLKKWQLHLTQLNIQMPIDRTSALMVWERINQQITPKKPSIISNFIKSWGYVFSGFSALGLLFSALLFTQTSNAQLDWDIDPDFAKRKLHITVTTHKHTNPTKVCVLWIKKNNIIYRIGLMPEVGKKTLKVTQNLDKIINDSEIIISLEEKESTGLLPTKIEFKQKWQS